MRSRYSAWVRGNAKYLHKTWDSRTRPSLTDLKDMPPVEWLGLKILRAEPVGVFETAGTVEFVASYRQENQIGQLHEVSRFERVDGRWLYIGGEQSA